MKTLISNLRVRFAALLMIVAVSSLSLAQQYTVTALNAPGTFSYALALSDNGQVAGYWLPHAFRWTATEGMQDLGVLSGSMWSSGLGINNSGQVVGYSSGDGFEEGFIWTPSGGMQNIGSFGGNGT